MLIFIILAIVVAAFLYSCYSGVIKARNQLDEALSGIDVQLKKRTDLVPNVLKIAKKFMDHESVIFTEITRLRTEVSKLPIGTAKRFSAEAELQQKMKQLTVSVENYPQLKSNETMVEAINTYNDTEENIAASRRFYNAALRELKNRVQIFPGSLFAGCAGDISELTYFQIDESEKKPVNADDYLK